MVAAVQLAAVPGASVVWKTVKCESRHESGGEMVDSKREVGDGIGLSGYVGSSSRKKICAVSVLLGF